LAEPAEAGLAANSVRIIHATLRTMLADAVRDELVERNVAAIVRGPRIDHEEIRPWSLEEAGTFLAAARGHRLSALFAVGVALGLRRGELLALAWDDVDLDGDILRVRRTVQRLRGRRSSISASRRALARIEPTLSRKVEKSCRPPRCMPTIRPQRVFVEGRPLRDRVAPASPA
jgi:integrase